MSLDFSVNFTGLKQLKWRQKRVLLYRIRQGYEKTSGNVRLTNGYDGILVLIRVRNFGQVIIPYTSGYGGVLSKSKGLLKHIYE